MFIKVISLIYEKFYFGDRVPLSLCFFLRGGGSKDLKFSQFQIFPKLGTRGSHQISNFSQIPKSPKHPGGGGIKKIVDFFHFL